MAKLSVTLGFALLACTDAGVPSDKQDYLGRWKGPRTVLEIRFDGQVRYSAFLAHAHRRVSGTIRAFDGDDFIVGWPWGTRFRVGRPPFLSNGRWKIIVNDVELERVSDLDEVIDV